MRSSVQLDRILFFGRTLADYTAFFKLNLTALQGGRVLDCGAGSASFAIEAARQGVPVTAVDPLYKLSPQALRLQAEADFEHSRERALQAADAFTPSAQEEGMEALFARRRLALNRFLEDYSHGRAQGRYQAGALPDLPFEADRFDLALCGHLLFLYADRLDEAFHLRACRELIRLAPEVRLYPLITLQGERYSRLDALRATLAATGIESRIERTDYEVFRGANEVLVLNRSPKTL